jgi:hypothetical protein
VDGDWFDLHASRFNDVLRPSSFESSIVTGFGDHNLLVRNCIIELRYEEPGILVSFQNDLLTEAEMIQLVEEIASNITNTLGQQSVVINL